MIKEFPKIAKLSHKYTLKYLATVSLGHITDMLLKQIYCMFVKCELKTYSGQHRSEPEHKSKPRNQTSATAKHLDTEI